MLSSLFIAFPGFTLFVVSKYNRVASFFILKCFNDVHASASSS